MAFRPQPNTTAPPLSAHEFLHGGAELSKEEKHGNRVLRAAFRLALTENPASTIVRADDEPNHHLRHLPGDY
jgi:hypothetical protein